MTETDPRFWRRHARRYDRVTLLLNSRFDELAGRIAGAIDGAARVLEIAAGTGLVTVRIAPRLGRLVATDRSPEMLAVLRGRMQAAGLGNVEVREADALALDFPDGSFDAVVMANLLHLLPEPERALEEARRILVPGGLLAAPTFCHGETLTAHVVSRTLGLAGFRVARRLAGADLRRLLEASRFAVEYEAVYPGLLPIRLAVGRS